MASEGPSGIVHESGQECVQEGTYGPWVVVCRRKGGTKYQRHGFCPASRISPKTNRVRMQTMKKSIDVEPENMRCRNKCFIMTTIRRGKYELSE